jgi:PTS system glucitol/sorbitol-specific IIA component
MYRSQVKEVGILTPSFAEDKVLVLFGPEAPQEIKDIALIHEVLEDSSDEPIKVGGKFQIDDQEFTITAVGNAANKNLKELGHISIYFSENHEDVLPGAVFATPSTFPEFNETSMLTFK